ncbi:ferritin-like domain-containing protein [Caldimonas tepidiphila]|uniref:ferritin-like domain-containing protein n=1 Tax=Caldimonas tepidiphila TaxID=2315841 RepID=UPI000E5ACED0|nr:ferritin-like protein [Caldimonas tepidiphila]
MTPQPTPETRDSREQLLHLLAEAAELEHNLLCCYLYAAFSLRGADDEALSAPEREAVQRWRRTILDVALEEMGHLALVANLTVACGLRPHFNRPNLPTAPNYHPADIVVELAPFDRDTLDHFIFLERPADVPVPDAASFAGRRQEAGRDERPGTALMPGAPRYRTIGEFYERLRGCLEALAAADARGLFCGDPAMQIGPDAVDLPGLAVVTDLDSARAALDTIVTQGEGGRADTEDSHFRRFCAIRDEFDALATARPGFRPAWPAARNPLMRRPADPEAGVHVDAPQAAAVLDLANALYGLTLRLLTQAWGEPDAGPGERRAMLSAAMALMSVFGPVGSYLCSLPASEAAPGVHAGVSFTMLRATEPAAGAAAARRLIRERLDELVAGMAAVAQAHPALARHLPRLEGVEAELPR